MKDVDEINNKNKRRKEDIFQATSGVLKEERIEYQSIQDTLRSLNELKTSPYKKQIENIKRSEQEMELDYSISSANFSRDEENNPLEDVSEIFKSVEK